MDQNGANGVFFGLARELLAALVLFVRYADAARVGGLGDVLRALHEPDLWEQMDAVADALDDRTVARCIRNSASSMRDQPLQSRESTLLVARMLLGLWASGNVDANTSGGSELAFRELLDGDVPTTVYVTIPQGSEETLRPLLRLLVAAAIDEFAAGPGKNRCLMALDEFPLLRKIPELENAVATLRGAGVVFLLLCQSIEQIYAAYGERTSIPANCAVQIATAPSDPKTAGHLSSMVGTETVLFAAKTRHPSGDSEADQAGPRQLLDPAGAMRGSLRPAKLSGLFCRGADALILVQGQPAIRGDLRPWFLDRAMRRRAGINPGRSPR